MGGVPRGSQGEATRWPTAWSVLTVLLSIYGYNDYYVHIW